MSDIKVTDYIVETLIKSGVDTVFGYPGGAICHLMDSLGKYSDKIACKINFHEQAAAFAACGYAQTGKRLGVAFATSGPGATNLVTGIADAWFDSLPVLFLTGQVDTYALKSTTGADIRQFGFQETDILSIVKSISKYSVQITSPDQICRELNKAIDIAMSGRKGPVVIDLPADVQRAMVDVGKLEIYTKENTVAQECDFAELFNDLSSATRPVVLAGAGINQADLRQEFRQFVERYQLPTVVSFPACDLLEYDHRLHLGFIGVNGHRYANLVLAKSDCVICLGSRLDLKQVGAQKDFFRPETKVIRIDVDAEELKLPVRANETVYCCDLKAFFREAEKGVVDLKNRDGNWVDIANGIKKELEFANDNEPVHKLLRGISQNVSADLTYALDVGQNELWAAQALELKGNQRLIMSAGLGTMGYAVPAAIGAYYATKNPAVAIVGDGGLQMNIQELQFIASNKLPVTVILCNNSSLGMIRQFQEKFLNSNFQHTTLTTGYSVPDFKLIAEAYGLKYQLLTDLKEFRYSERDSKLIELRLPDTTYLHPAFGRDAKYDQEPKIDRDLFSKIMKV